MLDTQAFDRNTGSSHSNLNQGQIQILYKRKCIYE